MSDLLQAIGKHVDSAPERKPGSKPSLAPEAPEASEHEGAPADLRSLHEQLKGLIPDSLLAELDAAIMKHSSEE